MLLQWNQQVTALTQSHLAFPILHFYYSRSRHLSLAVMIAVLDESLTVLRHNIPPNRTPNTILLTNTRSAKLTLLHTIHTEFIRASDSQLSAPPLDELSKAGIPVVTSADKDDHTDERRRLLLGFLQNEGRTWSDVYT